MCTESGAWIGSMLTGDSMSRKQLDTKYCILIDKKVFVRVRCDGCAMIQVLAFKEPRDLLNYK